MSSPSTLQDFQDIVNETDRRRTPSTPTAINEPTNVQNIKSVMAGLKTCFIGPRDQSGDRTKVPSSQKDRKIGPFEIISNYVEVKKLPGILYQYSLTFQRGPTTDPIVLNRRCEIIAAFDAMIAADALKLNQRVWATDYKDLWCDTPLDPLVLGASQQFEFTQLNGRVAGDLMVNAKYQKSQDSTPQIIEQSNIGDLTELTRAMNAHVTKGVRESNQNPDDEIIQVGANKFFLKGGYQQLVRGLVAVRGYYTSIRPTTSGFLLNVNTATSAFLEPIRVSTLLSYFGNDTKYVEKMLKGKTVRIIYERENYDEDKSKVDPNGDLARTKVFQNFGLSATKQQFFNILRDENDPNKKTVDPEDEGTFVSEFFETVVRGLPRDECAQRCVNVGPRSVKGCKSAKEESLKGSSWVPACLLEILPNQPMTVPMNPETTSSMIEKALRYPIHNLGLINEEGLVKLGIKPSAQNATGMQDANTRLGELGFALGQELIKFSAARLATPLLFYHDRRTGATIRKNENTASEDSASWDVIGCRFVNPSKDLHHVHALGLEGWNQKGGNQDDIHRSLIAKLSYHGVQSADDTDNDFGWSGHQSVYYPEDPNNLREGETKDPVEAFELHLKQVKNKKDDLTLILLRNKDYAMYASMKRIADLEHGHPTSFAVGEKIKNLSGQVLSNLALKVNMKLGGVNHHLVDPDLGKDFVNRNQRLSTMVLGADVTHPAAASKSGCPSIACVVASVDEKVMKYLGSMRLQAGGQEKIECMRSMVEERLIAWRDARKTLPTSILMYRDGVSESQLNDITSYECDQIRAAYGDLAGEDAKKKLKITFIVVNKRHNTRFYPSTGTQTYTEQGKNGRFLNGNLKPGLLVDDVVTNTGDPNFFLQSHRAIKGTARYAHYHVTLDEMDLKDRIPSLTLKLCYAFGRSTTAVSYAAPAYMADRLCERGRAYLRHWMEDSNMEPIFNMPPYKVGGVQKRATKSYVNQQKQKFATAIAQHPKIDGKPKLWGQYDESPPNGAKPRLNPWHPYFDDKMFWM